MVTGTSLPSSMEARKPARRTPSGILVFALMGFLASDPLEAFAADETSGPASASEEQEEEQEQAETQEPEPAPAAEDAPGTRLHSIEVGGGLTRGYTNGVFTRFKVWEPSEYAVTVEFGTQHGFGRTDAAVGGSYLHHLASDATVTVGAAAGRSIFFPELLWGVAFAKPVADLGLSGGYLRRQWDDGGYSNEVTGGVNRWFAHWIVGGYVRYHWGEPNHFRSVGGGVGLSYYVWREYTFGVGFDIGDEVYREALFDLQPKGVNMVYSRWFSESSGINVRFDHGWSTFAGKITGITASWFKEW
jgi:YaiO family outer membrane protein